MALAQIIPLFPGKKPNLFPVTPLFPVLDLRKISPGQALTVCFESRGDEKDRTRISFLITKRATFNIEGAARGILTDCRLSRELKNAFSGLGMSSPVINDPCILFGSCLKDERSFLGVGELRLNKIIKYKLFYWATKFENKREKPWIFPYSVRSWLIH